MAITGTPSAMVEEGAGPLGRGFGAPLSPVTEHPRAARWSVNIAVPESEPPAQAELLSRQPPCLRARAPCERA